MLCHEGIGFRLNVHSGAGGDIVKDQGNGTAVGNGKKGSGQPLLGGFIVIGCHHQRRIGTKSGRLFCVRNGFGRIVAAGACNEGNSAAGGFSTCRQNLLIFLLGKRGRFARGSATYQSVDSLGNLPVNQFFVSGKVGSPLLICRSDQCGGRTLENTLFHL